MKLNSKLLKAVEKTFDKFKELKLIADNKFYMHVSKSKNNLFCDYLIAFFYSDSNKLLYQIISVDATTPSSESGELKLDTMSLSSAIQRIINYAIKDWTTDVMNICIRVVPAKYSIHEILPDDEVGVTCIVCNGEIQAENYATILSKEYVTYFRNLCEHQIMPNKTQAKSKQTHEYYEVPEKLKSCTDKISVELKDISILEFLRNDANVNDCTAASLLTNIMACIDPGFFQSLPLSDLFVSICKEIIYAIGSMYFKNSYHSGIVNGINMPIMFDYSTYSRHVAVSIIADKTGNISEVFVRFFNRMKNKNGSYSKGKNKHIEIYGFDITKITKLSQCCSKAFYANQKIKHAEDLIALCINRCTPDMPSSKLSNQVNNLMGTVAYISTIIVLDHISTIMVNENETLKNILIWSEETDDFIAKLFENPNSVKSDIDIIRSNEAILSRLESDINATIGAISDKPSDIQNNKDMFYDFINTTMASMFIGQVYPVNPYEYNSQIINRMQSLYMLNAYLYSMNLLKDSKKYYDMKYQRDLAPIVDAQNEVYYTEKHYADDYIEISVCTTNFCKIDSIYGDIYDISLNIYDKRMHQNIFLMQDITDTIDIDDVQHYSKFLLLYFIFHCFAYAIPIHIDACLPFISQVQLDFMANDCCKDTSENKYFQSIINKIL